MRELVRYALLETFKYTVQYLLSRCQYHTVFITVVLWILESSSISLPVVFFTSEGFPGDARVKNLPASARDARDVGSIPGSGRSAAGGDGQPTPLVLPRIPWTEEPGGLRRVKLCKEDWRDLARTAWPKSSSFVPPFWRTCIRPFTFPCEI